jgi:hypothetical protein
MKKTSGKADACEVHRLVKAEVESIKSWALFCNFTEAEPEIFLFFLESML